MNHEHYMKRCLDLARMAYPACRPNPMVGAVLVHEEQIISEGYTQAYGHAHAEVKAISGISDELLSMSTLYVSLEPCAHHGKTPPCADLIVEKKIPRVVIACRDPFDAVDGKGIERLCAAGVEVIEGVLESEAKELNKRFFTFHEKKRPYVVLKWAETADGFVDVMRESGTALKISCPQSNQLVHSWRAEEQAILIGGNTARMDNPQLNVRLVEGPDPVRFVWSSEELDADNSLTKSGYTLVAANDVEGVLSALYEAGMQSVLIEGGAQVLRAFVETGTYDEVRRIIGTKPIGCGVDAPRIRIEADRVERSDRDVVRYYYA